MNMKINNYELDKDQQKAIKNNYKYTIITAGAGSGKTITLIGKIKYLLDNKIVTKDQICAISFTNESVNNFQKNIKKNINVTINTYTFHKLALNILNKTNQEYIINNDLLREIIEEFFNKLYHNNKYTQKAMYKILKIHGPLKQKKYNTKNKEQLKKLCQKFIELYITNGYQKQDFIKLSKKTKQKPFLYLTYAIYIRYNTQKEINHEIDFDDIIIKATDYINKHQNFLPYKYIIIDEFQDTSLIRFKLIQAIINKTNASLCVCGDDYQSIYNFSGSNINLFLKFKDYLAKN